MSIASAITAAQGKVADCYTAISGKGGTLPVTQNLSNMPTAISSIPSGGVGITREVSAQGVYQMPASNFTFSLQSNATDVGNKALSYAFYGSTYLTGIDLSSITRITGSNALNNAFSDCTGITYVDLSNITTISGNNALYNAFYGCSNLTTVNLSGLTTVTGDSALYNTFSNCGNISNIDLSSLTTVSGYDAFYYAFSGNKATSIDLSSLTTVSGERAMIYAFQNSDYIQSVDLSSLTLATGTNCFNLTFYGCDNIVSVDLSNLEQIGSDNSSMNSGQFAQCFYQTQVTSLNFPKLEKIYCTGYGSATYGSFSGNSSVQKMYFPKLNTISYGSGASSMYKNACKYIFANCSSLTELHFGSANQSAIQATAGYSTAWGRGAGNVTIYFDL